MIPYIRIMANMGKERRKYIRHPSDIPIVYELTDAAVHQKENLRNISIGGLSFRTDRCLEKETPIVIQIDLVRPVFKGKAIVMWCRLHNEYYDIGVQFVDKDTEFRARMVEQICHIEQYKREILEKEGRELSGEEAAREWINKYAKDFP
jgi:hypothetical protein